MSPDLLRDEILRLPPAERLRLLEDLWDSLAASPEHVPLPDAHRAELEARLTDPAEQASLSWDDVRRTLPR
jgi:putative addiction module component (TIGR02574 family)